jgi:peptide/nickel transport system substrate-binding protein
MATSSKLFAAILSIALAACAAPAWAGKGDDTLNVAFSQEITSLDNYQEPSREGLILARLLYDSLLDKDTKTGAFKPELATSYRFVDDRTLEFELRKGVKFHDGSTMTADDVVYTLNLVSTKEYNARYQIAVSWIEKAEKIDDYKVRLIMKKPYPLALEMLAGNLPIYPKAYYEKTGPSGMGAKPVGSGPYKLVELTPGSRFVFERFDGYYADSPKGRAAIKRLIVRIQPEANTQYAELSNGQLDWIWRVPPDAARNLARRSNIEIKSAEILRFAYITFFPGFNDGKSPLADVRVRRALTHAVDRPAIIKAFVGGASQVLKTACNPLQFGCSTDVVDYPYDPAKAKQLLAEAGYPNGFTIDLLSAANPTPQVEAIVANFAKVGVKANMVEQQFASALGGWREGKYGMFMINWGSYGIADASLATSPFFNGAQDDRAKDPELIKLLAEADSSVDPGVRKRDFTAALKRIAEQAYWLPLWTFSITTAQSKDLAFSLDPDEFARFYAATWK